MNAIAFLGPTERRSTGMTAASDRDQFAHDIVDGASVGLPAHVHQPFNLFCSAQLSGDLLNLQGEFCRELGRDVRAHQLLVEHSRSRRKLVACMPVSAFCGVGFVRI